MVDFRALFSGGIRFGNTSPAAATPPVITTPLSAKARSVAMFDHCQGLRRRPYALVMDPRQQSVMDPWRPSELRFSTQHDAMAGRKLWLFKSFSELPALLEYITRTREDRRIIDPPIPLAEAYLGPEMRLVAVGLLTFHPQIGVLPLSSEHVQMDQPGLQYHVFPKEQVLEYAAALPERAFASIPARNLTTEGVNTPDYSVTTAGQAMVLHFSNGFLARTPPRLSADPTMRDARGWYGFVGSRVQKPALKWGPVALGSSAITPGWSP